MRCPIKHTYNLLSGEPPPQIISVLAPNFMSPALLKYLINSPQQNENVVLLFVCLINKE